jgi:hypothetical protein
VPTPAGFTYVRRKNGEIVIAHRGRRAAVLRGRSADELYRRLEAGDVQELLARATGNYKRGNERRSSS